MTGHCQTRSQYIRCLSVFNQVSAKDLISAIILAAGRSSRMPDEFKLLADLHGKPLLRWVVDAALACRAGEVLVVCGAQSERLRQAFADLPLRWVENPDFALGMSTSLRRGVEAVSPTASAALILLADQPLVTAQMLNQMIRRFEAGDVRVVACRYGDWVGTPALFHRELFEELARLEGDRGAKSVVTAHSREAAFLDFPSELSTDVDTQTDLERLRMRLRAGGRV